MCADRMTHPCTQKRYQKPNFLGVDKNSKMTICLVKISTVAAQNVELPGRRTGLSHLPISLLLFLIHYFSHSDAGLSMQLEKQAVCQLRVMVLKLWAFRWGVQRGLFNVSLSKWATVHKTFPISLMDFVFWLFLSLHLSPSLMGGFLWCSLSHPSTNSGSLELWLSERAVWKKTLGFM